jgi:hypothetical protein
MPFKIDHICNPGDPTPKPYSIMRGERTLGTLKVPLTRILCTDPTCREEFFILGHEMFNQAHTNDEVQPGRDLPPGFVIARSRSS